MAQAYMKAYQHAMACVRLPPETPPTAQALSDVCQVAVSEVSSVSALLHSPLMQHLEQSWIACYL